MAKANVPATKGAAPGTSLVKWQDQLAKEAAAVAEQEKSESQFLSFRGGILAYGENPIPGNKLKVVVMDSAYEHAWYPGAFDPNNPVSPSCWAAGRVESELAPTDDVDDKQNADCASCELNKWGSDPDGGRGKACKNIRRLSLMDATVLDAGPDGIMAATVVNAKLPVTSGKFYSSFAVQIANVVKRPPHGVIAEISVVPDPRYQFLVKWAFVEVVPDELIPAIMAKRDTLKDDILYDYPSNAEREQQAAAQRPAPPPVRGRQQAPQAPAGAQAGKGRKF